MANDKMTWTELRKAVAEMAGTYKSYTYNEVGVKVSGTDTLVIDGKNDTFTLTRSINGKTEKLRKNSN